LPLQGKHHDFLRNSEETALCDCAGRCGTGRATGHGVFANKIRVTQNVENCFFSGLRLD
jgi:hypothetical protein